ncbi:MAG: restriction endonuclease [Actinomycetota bacterium]|nr:restriction endonuclease [Actinomycetota bacterium]
MLAVVLMALCRLGHVVALDPSGVGPVEYLARYEWLVGGLEYPNGFPIQAKQQDRVGRNVVDNFETAVERAGQRKGFLVAFSFTKNAEEEAERAKAAGKVDVQLVTVAELIRNVPS